MHVQPGPGEGVAQPCGAGATPAASGESGGTQPPLIQSQLEAGLIVGQEVTTGGAGAAGGLGVGMPPVAVSSGESGGTQPPLRQTQFAAGLIVVQVPASGADGGEVGGGGGVEGGGEVPSGAPAHPAGAGPVLGPLPVVKVQISEPATRA